MRSILADHKQRINRAEQDFELDEEAGQTGLDGLFTAPTNTIYLPVALIRPTDFSTPLRNLLNRRVASLYGSFCAPLPNRLSLQPAASHDWELDCFAWAETVGDPQWVSSFLKFRSDTMARLFDRR